MMNVYNLFHNNSYSTPQLLYTKDFIGRLLPRKCHLLCVEVGLLDRVIIKTIKQTITKTSKLRLSDLLLQTDNIRG